MAQGTITIRTDPDIETQLNALAKATERSRNWLIEQAIKAYLAENTWQVAGIKAAQQSLDAGQGVRSEQVFQRLHSSIAKHEE